MLKEKCSINFFKFLILKAFIAESTNGKVEELLYRLDYKEPETWSDEDFVMDIRLFDTSELLFKLHYGRYKLGENPYKKTIGFANEFFEMQDKALIELIGDLKSILKNENCSN